MRDSWSSHESWTYECLNCLTTWQEEYDARHVADGHGGEAVIYEHDGHRCTSPWCDHVCPRCGGQNVKALATPLAEAQDVASPVAGRSDDLAMVFRLRRLHAY